MKKFLNIGVVSLALILTACGGDSDSSGSEESSNSNDTPSTIDQNEVTNDSTPSDSTNICESAGTEVYATASGCEYSIANYNSGEPQTYICEGGRIRSGGISATQLVFNGITIKCAS